MIRARGLCGLMLAAGLLVARPVAAETADTQAPSPAANVSLTLTVGNVGGKSPFERKYRVLTQDRAVASLLMGWRTPIPMTSGATDDGGKAVTTFTYQNIGVSSSLRVTTVGSAKVAVDGDIEVSGAREGPAVDASGTKAPIIGTFQQHLQVVATEGHKLRVAEVPDPEGGTLYLDLEVDVLN